MSGNGTLAPTEPHPAAYDARAWIARQPVDDIARWQEAFSSCAIEGNRIAEVCSETLRRLLNGEPVSDRYLLGLAWTMRADKNQISLWCAFCGKWGDHQSGTCPNIDHNHATTTTVHLSSNNDINQPDFNNHPAGR